ncbi:hypothetical protein PIIN_11651 [Serendipita indica DSM 11827]|uniref:Uncharacterized protein n=1 Tax=Serendipita indica (strain DSM 11827) TaxID=1109443 RepID=G4U280_SERID|nr:hypothetical protein PIIN_11651 [Serendipita indica DSM 11827]
MASLDEQLMDLEIVALTARVSGQATLDWLPIHHRQPVKNPSPTHLDSS